MTSERIKTLVLWAGAILLAGVFLYAGIPKLLDPARFGESIHRYDMLPGGAVSLMAIYLPWLEVCAALFVLTPRYRQGAAALIAGMLVMFLIAIVNALLRDLDISCGCFSGAGAEDTIGGLHIVRNIGLMATALMVSWLARGNPVQQSASS